MKISVTDSSGNPIQLSTTPILAALLLLLFSAVMIGAYNIGDDQHALFKMLAEGLMNIVIGVSAYYFGSSAGSKNKDDTIAQALTNPKDTP